MRRILGDRIYGALKSVAARGKVKTLKPGDPFLNQVSGVIHVGANVGQEREQYARHDLDVVWIEPIPEVFAELKRNLEQFPKQQAFEYLVADKDGEEHVFHIADNDGRSSSILDINLHKEIWPDVSYQESIVLKSTTLASMVERERLDLGKYQALVMDTQGSELLVLKGATELLGAFTYIKTEAADFECYAGGCTVAEIEQFLARHGFQECTREEFASREGVGTYYDIVFQRPQEPE